MASNQNDHATHASYAQALVELSDARGVTDQVAGDLKAIAEAVRADAALKKYFADPTIGRTERADKIGRVFGGQTPEVLIGFLKLLNAKGRLGELDGIAAAFAAILSERAGEQQVEVTVPEAMSDSELEDVRVEISKKIGKHARITQKVDASIIGGLVLKIGDKLIDGSVKTQLETMKRRLVAAV